MKFKKNIMIPFCLIIGFMLAASCSESDPTSVSPQEKPPEVPSAQSIAFDLSIFESQQPTGGDNYQQASQAIKQIKFTQNRSIDPVRNLLESADTANAKQLKEGKWQWKYSSNEGRLNYGIRLVAIQKKTDKIKWKVFITSQLLQNREILFITGTTNSQVTEGMWTYYNFPRAGQPQQKFATLKWKIEKDQDIHMKLQIVADISFQGSAVIYDAEEKIRTILLKSSDKPKTTIKFNVDTNVGFIIAPNYNNYQKACWNSDFEDVPCSKIDVG